MDNLCKVFGKEILISKTEKIFSFNGKLTLSILEENKLNNSSFLLNPFYSFDQSINTKSSLLLLVKSFLSILAHSQ